MRGRWFSSRPRWAPARAGSSNSSVFPVMKRVASATFAAIAARPRTSRPMVTVYTRPRNRRRTRGLAHTTPASVVFPKPPAPDSEVVIPTAPPLPHTAATTSSPCPRSTTQSATGCGSGGGGSPAAAAGFSCRTATAAATRTASRAVPPTDSQELRRNRSRTPGQRASDVAALAASAPSTASATPAPASSTMPVTRPRTRTPVYPVVRPAPTLSATTGARWRVAARGATG